jgi:hypothetical protein
MISVKEKKYASSFKLIHTPVLVNPEFLLKRETQIYPEFHARACDPCNKSHKNNSFQPNSPSLYFLRILLRKKIFLPTKTDAENVRRRGVPSPAGRYDAVTEVFGNLPDVFRNEREYPLLIINYSLKKLPMKKNRRNR